MSVLTVKARFKPWRAAAILPLPRAMVSSRRALADAEVGVVAVAEQELDRLPDAHLGGTEEEPQEQAGGGAGALWHTAVAPPRRASRPASSRQPLAGRRFAPGRERLRRWCGASVLTIAQAGSARRLMVFVFARHCRLRLWEATPSPTDAATRADRRTESPPTTASPVTGRLRCSLTASNGTLLVLVFVFSSAATAGTRGPIVRFSPARIASTTRGVAGRSTFEDLGRRGGRPATNLRTAREREADRVRTRCGAAANPHRSCGRKLPEPGRQHLNHRHAQHRRFDAGAGEETHDAIRPRRQRLEVALADHLDRQRRMRRRPIRAPDRAGARGCGLTTTRPR